VEGNKKQTTSYPGHAWELKNRERGWKAAKPATSAKKQRGNTTEGSKFRRSSQAPDWARKNTFSDRREELSNLRIGMPTATTIIAALITGISKKMWQR